MNPIMLARKTAAKIESSPPRHFSAGLAMSIAGLLALPQLSNAFTMSGQIVTGSGSGVSGATVNLISGATVRTATTDGLGNYTLTGVPSGSWIVKPVKASTLFTPDSMLLNAQVKNASMNFVGSAPTTVWTAKDIGAVISAGSSTVQGGSVVMKVTGTELGGGLDSKEALHFYHIGVLGDGDLIAKVGNLTGGGENAAVGVMFRENTADNARFTAFVFRPHQADPGARAMMISRTTPAYDTPNGGCKDGRCVPMDITKPVWLRIHRQANDFMFYWSTDGAGWIYCGYTTVAMTQNLVAGAILVGPDGTPTQATVEKLSFAPNSTPSVAVAASATTAATGAVINLTATATDADGYLSSVQYFVNGTRVGFAGQAPYQVSWGTTGLPAGKYLVMAKAMDEKGAYRFSAPKTITLTGTTPARLAALLVVKSTTLSTSDAILRDRLNSLGFNVTVKTDVAALATDTTGKALVVLAPSASAANVGAKFKAVKKSVLVANPELYAVMGMTGSVLGTDYGFVASKDSLNLIGCDRNLLNWSLNGGVNRNNGLANCHDLTAGLFGKRQVQKTRGNVSWAKPTAAAKVAASLDNDVTKASIFSYTQGAVMAANFVAPGRRAGIWLDTLSSKSFSDAGRSLFDAAVYWAAQARTPITKKVFVINYNPILVSKGGVRMNVYKGYADAHESTREYLSDLTEASGGYVRWQLVDFKDVNGMPINNTGYIWNETTILAAIDNGVYPPGGADYSNIIDTYGLDAKVKAGQVDEVVMYGPGGAGFDEAHMAGKDPFGINGGTTFRAGVPNYAIMGLNSDRGTAEALESFGHRVEATMSSVMGWGYSDCEGYPDFRQRNAWEQFATNQKTALAGQPTGMGNAHYSPVTPTDYYWDARWYFPYGPYVTARTYADDWAANYPFLKGTVNTVDSKTWDPAEGTSLAQHDRGFKRWWLGHMPRVLGNTIDGSLETRLETVAAHGTGYSNNWWDYMVDFNKRPESQGPHYPACRESYHAPEAPQDPTATAGTAQVALAWSPSIGSIDYIIEKSANGTSWTPLNRTVENTFVATGLTNGVGVWFRIRGANEFAASTPSAPVFATPGGSTEPCSPATTVSAGSGSLGTAAGVCLKTSDNIQGWGCSNFDGRTIKVNGVAVTCSQVPLPAKVGGYNYFDIGPGAFSWASLYWW